MLTFRIHFKRLDGTQHSFVIRGETIAELRKKVDTELDSRKAVMGTVWSEEVY